MAVRAAAGLFRKRGFDGVGLKEIMGAIGMTHGGFYRHFSTKADLASEAITVASRDTLASHAKVVSRGRPRDARRAFVARYLSAEHVAHAERGCPLAALGSEAARQPRAIRGAYTSAVKAALAMLEHGLAPSSQRRTGALQTLASLVGGVVLARASNDPKLAAELLGAVRARILDRL